MDYINNLLKNDNEIKNNGFGYSINNNFNPDQFDKMGDDENESYSCESENRLDTATVDYDIGKMLCPGDEIMYKPRKQVMHWVCCLFVLAGLAGISTDAAAARIKDLAAIKGIRSNQLTGYGLVVGLNGTGDKNKVSFTRQALANMMEKMNIYVDQNQLKVKNVAAVMATAAIPPFARTGDR